MLYYEIKDIMTIGVIGATGKLGVSLMKQPNTVACDVRFEEAERYNQWLSDHPDVDENFSTQGRKIADSFTHLLRLCME